MHVCFINDIEAIKEAGWSTNSLSDLPKILGPDLLSYKLSLSKENIHKIDLEIFGISYIFIKSSSYK